MNATALHSSQLLRVPPSVSQCLHNSVAVCANCRWSENNRAHVNCSSRAKLTMNPFEERLAAIEQISNKEPNSLENPFEFKYEARLLLERLYDDVCHEDEVASASFAQNVWCTSTKLYLLFSHPSACRLRLITISTGLLSCTISA